MTALKSVSAIVSVLGVGVLAAAPAHGDNTGSIALIVDYSNGARTTFAQLAFQHGMSVVDTLLRASKTAPGLVVEEVRPDRGGDVSVILDCTSGAWNFWIDERGIGGRLRAHGDPSGQEVQAGDAVLAKVTGDDVAARPAQTPAATVALVVDYSNGTQKSFAAVPWQEDIDVLELLLTAARTRPGLDVDFGVLANPNTPEAPLVDRADHEIGALRSLDGIGGAGGAWQVWIDGRDLGTELRSRSRFSAGSPQVTPGAMVLLKWVASENAYAGPWHEPTSTIFLQPAAGPECG